MDQQSPFILVKDLEGQLNGVLSGLDVYTLPKPDRKLVAALRRELTDARLDVRDYELSETRAEQLKKAIAGKERLGQLQKLILAASELDIFSAIDVAQLTARLDQVTVHLE